MPAEVLTTFAVLADIHLGLRLYGQAELETDLRNQFRRAVELATSLGVREIVIAGDLFDTNRPTPDLVAFVRDVADRARAVGTGMCGIAGDHDRPVNGESWARLSGIRPVNEVPEFAGEDYGDDPVHVLELLVRRRNPERVRWVFLHGQVPVLWQFCCERKRLPLDTVDLFRHFPKLRGVILGDIHDPKEGSLVGTGGKEAYIGYPGSLSVTSASDMSHRPGMLHFDGKRLARVEIPPEREHIRLDLDSPDLDLAKVRRHAAALPRPPVFLVEHTPASRGRLAEVDPLYQLGLVRTRQVVPRAEPGTAAVNLRTEVSNEARLAGVLDEMVPDAELRTLLSDLLKSDDPRSLLDGFRQRCLG
jgi:DNA repair exonuclease SbcCD nuclease subunit